MSGENVVRSEDVSFGSSSVLPDPPSPFSRLDTHGDGDVPRKRHVKCDEAKPSCQRCIKWQGYCDGYDASSSSRQPTQPSGSPSPPSATELARKLNSPTLMEPNFNSSVFSHEWEKAYFDRWLALAPSLAGGWFPSQLWTTTIPQLCTEEPAVRYAAVAIGAMAKAVYPNMVHRSPGTLMANGPHYHTALTYYGRALRQLRLQQQPDQASGLRAALLSCLLFICFETLRGEREPAMHHIGHGLQMMEQFVGACSPPGTDASFDRVMTRSPSPFVLEDEVVQTFQRLDVLSCSLSILQPRRPSAPAQAKAAVAYPLDSVPTSFDSLDEARRWWDLIAHWMLEFPRRMVLELQGAHCIGAGDVRGGREDEGGIGHLDVPESLALQQQNLECLERWSVAFWPLYSAGLQNKKKDEAAYLMCLSLQYQFLIQWISVRSLCFAQYDVISTITPQFRELNRLAALLLPRQPGIDGSDDGDGEAFTLDNGPTLGLFITATKCRDERVREEAIRLLKAHPRRDGFWDSRALVAIAVCNRVVEAEDRREGDDPHKQYSFPLIIPSRRPGATQSGAPHSSSSLKDIPLPFPS